MTKRVYTAADITVLSMADSVRRRPGMYFRVGPGDPRLATQALDLVVDHAFHPNAKLAAHHAPHVRADITSDLAFSVTDDLAETLTGQDTPRLGHDNSLLNHQRWASAVIAAVSSQTTVEIWRDRQGFRQTLAGSRPVAPAAKFPAPAGVGTRLTFVLDRAFFGSAVITTDLAALPVCGPYCTDAAGPGEIVIRDHRNQNGPTEYRYP